MNLGKLASLELLLEFEVAFPGEKRENIEEYLHGASKEMILKTATIFLSFKNHGSKYSIKSFLESFFCSENNSVANEIYKRIKRIEDHGTSVQIINTYSSLKLFELVFTETEETNSLTQSEFEINLFKAYLVLNSELTEKQKIALSSTRGLERDKYFPLVFFCSEYPLFDKTNFTIKQVWLIQLIKAVYLFKFLEETKLTEELFKEFLAHFECKSWNEYLIALLSLTISVVNREDEQNIDIHIPHNEHFDKNCNFLEKLMIHPVDNFDKNDFLSLRAKPIYKIGLGKYRIIFNLFAVEKIFKGVYFVLRDLNKNLPEEHKVKNIRSFYGQDFSEKILLYNAIESIFADKCIKFSGTQISDARIDGVCDYYVRKGKKILLFETKDFLIDAEKKMSFNYEVYEEEFGKVLDYEDLPNGREKPKAIVQLGNSIRKTLSRKINLDVNYHHKEVSIYPIFVTHDFQYDTPGFNELLNLWFQDELKILQKEGFYVNKIRPLAVINIDTLLYFQGVLKEKLTLTEAVDNFHEFKKLPKIKTNFKTTSKQDEYQRWYRNQILNKLVPFHSFLEKLVKKNKLWVIPSISEEISPELFKEL